MQVVKAHGYGNDFLLVDVREIAAGADRVALAIALCDRRSGPGADGLLFVEPTVDGAAMQLLNADGSYSEVSGNGVRCIGAWLADERSLSGRAVLKIRTDAGDKTLELLETSGPHEKAVGRRHTFRAAMGEPKCIRRLVLDVEGEPVDLVTLDMGNPQCVVLGDVTEARLHRLGRRLAVHPHFPQGTNVELARVDSQNRITILIWERGVGPTSSSGTGSCGAAVAAAAFGGTARTLEVTAPGGTQRVEWTDEGVWLTGWAEVLEKISI